jgi:alanyl-tRNA synthetase
MARERELAVDEAGFNSAMEVQKNKSREAGKWDYHVSLKPDDWRELTPGTASRFVGYTDLEIQSEIRRCQQDGDQVVLTLSDTPFYAESGGQVGDKGRLEGEGFALEIVDVQKIGSHIAHVGRLLRGKIENPRVLAKVDAQLRLDTARNHTATHLLHRALRDTVGKHVSQAGSQVAPERLRFDVTHFERIVPAQLEDLEGIVNEQVRADLEITTTQMPYDEARKLGAMAIFEEKYGDVVRVVKIGDFSLELCGGTHLQHTGEIGLFSMLSESSAAAGIRRLEAATGRGSELLIRKERRVTEELRALLNSTEDDLTERVRQLLEERKNVERELRQLRLKLSQQNIAELANRAATLNGFRFVAAKVEASNSDDLKQMSDTLREKLGSGVGVLAAVMDDKLTFACVVTDDLIKNKKLKAGDIVKRVAQIVGGSGGGKPHLALAGGKDVPRLHEALNQVPQILQEMTNR